MHERLRTLDINILFIWKKNLQKKKPVQDNENDILLHDNVHIIVILICIIELY